jgi:hypothetical protein
VGVYIQWKLADSTDQGNPTPREPDIKHLSEHHWNTNLYSPHWITVLMEGGQKERWVMAKGPLVIDN